MPTAPGTVSEPTITEDEPYLELLISPAPLSRIPVAQVETPSRPTARIHWVGGFVDRRHPADLYADIVARTPNLVVVDACYPEAYARACEALGIGIDETVFIDDMPKYVRGFLELGGRGLLIDEADRFAHEGLPRIQSLSELPAFIASI